MSMETVRIGEFLFKRGQRDRKPYKVKILTIPDNGIVGVEFSNGEISSVNMEDLYRNWKEAEDVSPIRPPSYSSAKQKSLQLSRWTCSSCSASNIRAVHKCWRCGKEREMNGSRSS